ncbi:hypothetical protein OHA72_42545 [Dactylosporangium sp. NBC_01737]|uniref:hypothetical protein n=1 Tax=Dactylosporangium sp. NBC_01737 TaxID=2975959 RepID=UPI002E160A29|nr:hypothetical protein OHA72_42545 [Dactylosporangium sp. NBC_01737]
MRRPRPARPGAAPPAAGKVSVVAAGASSVTRRASSTTRPSTAASAAATVTSAPPSSSRPSSMRRFGFGSSPPGSPSAARSASRPTTGDLPRLTCTADGNNGDPSMTTDRIRPSGNPSIATVFVVPRSMLNR